MKLPHTVEYTTQVAAGDAKYWKVRINPKYQFDKGLMAHEYEHIKQWYRSLILFIPLAFIAYFVTPTALVVGVPLVLMLHNNIYGSSEKYRFYCEVRAFRAQIKTYKYEAWFFDWAANALVNQYNLKVTKEQALNALKSRR